VGAGCACRGSGRARAGAPGTRGGIGPTPAGACRARGGAGLAQEAVGGGIVPQRGAGADQHLARGPAPGPQGAGGLVPQAAARG
jgi:hypothetical protein